MRGVVSWKQQDRLTQHAEGLWWVRERFVHARHILDSQKAWMEPYEVKPKGGIRWKP